MCELAVLISPKSLGDVPQQFVTEEMLMSVAHRACALLRLNFPERFRTREFIAKIIEAVPDAANYIQNLC